MPAPGDQHTSWANPFEEAVPRISQWTAREIATMAARLDKQLGPEYISWRSGPGGSRVHYLTAEKCIGLANQVFGFNGWSSSIQNIQVDFADEHPQTQRVSIGLSVIVRVTLRDGTYHEDIGYGSIENARGKAMAFEKAKKEGTTDGLKRALRSFGNVLGNCIYDQDYVKQVTKVKAQPVKKFDQDNLHRHADFVKQDPVKAETAVVELKPDPAESFEDFLGELDEADFCVPGDGHPDEVVLSNPPPQAHGPNEKAPVQPSPPIQQVNTRHMDRVASGGSSTGRPPHTPNAAHQSRPITRGQGPQNGPAPAARGRDSPKTTMQPPQRPAPQQQHGSALEPVAFFSAKSVNAHPDANDSAQKGTTHGPKQLFNPKAESPSIRKTPGIDHSSSRPVARTGQHVAPTSSQSPAVPTGGTSGGAPLRTRGNSGPGARGNVVNPSLDQTRRIGAPPGGLASPLANRASYKPPSMKRPLQGDGLPMGAARSPLADIAANTTGPGQGPAAESLDAKRQRMV